MCTPKGLRRPLNALTSGLKEGERQREELIEINPTEEFAMMI